MLLTLTISETETRAWATSPAVRRDARRAAAKAAVKAGRRFYQVRGADGRVLAVGEVDLTARAA